MRHGGIRLCIAEPGCGGALPGDLSLFRSMTRSALQTRWQVGVLRAEAGAARGRELPPPSAGALGLVWLRDQDRLGSQTLVLSAGCDAGQG